MSPESDHHDDLAAYLIGGLEPGERERFEAHLAECPYCAGEATELSAVTRALAEMAEPFEAPPDLQAKAMAAVDVAARAESPDRSAAVVAVRARGGPRMPRWPRLAATALAGVGALAAAVVIGVQLGGEDGGEDGDPIKRGTVEVNATMSAPDGSSGGKLVVTMFDSGRRISYESDELPILPKGDYYELWFVGPGDTRSTPNRISAGTFHPNATGVSDVILHAAVDPALLPRVEVTREPGNGSPGVDGPVVDELESTELQSP